MSPEDRKRAFTALGVRFYSGDIDAEISVAQWFGAMLKALWSEGDSFSGKRPLGNSGWESDPVPALIDAGLVNGEYLKTVRIGTGVAKYESIDELKYSHQEYDKLMEDAIVLMTTEWHYRGATGDEAGFPV